MARTNPNGANQYHLDPRQKMCWDLYIDPRSETFSNAYRSALKAGYENSYALDITSRDWFNEKVVRNSLLPKAEKALREALEVEVTIPKDQINSAVFSIKTDVAKFVAKMRGRSEGWNDESEQTNMPTVVLNIAPELAGKRNKHATTQNTSPGSV